MQYKNHPVTDLSIASLQMVGKGRTTMIQDNVDLSMAQAPFSSWISLYALKSLLPL